MRSKNDACLDSGVAPGPCAVARPTSQNQERTEFSKRSRGGGSRDGHQMRSAKQMAPGRRRQRATNRIERRREAAKAQPPPRMGTPVVAEPCSSPFSGGDSPSTRLDSVARALKLTALSPFLPPFWLFARACSAASCACAGGRTPTPLRPLKYRWTSPGRSPQEPGALDTTKVLQNKPQH